MGNHDLYLCPCSFSLLRKFSAYCKVPMSSHHRKVPLRRVTVHRASRGIMLCEPTDTFSFQGHEGNKTHLRSVTVYLKICHGFRWILQDSINAYYLLLETHRHGCRTTDPILGRQTGRSGQLLKRAEISEPHHQMYLCQAPVVRHMCNKGTKNEMSLWYQRRQCPTFWVIWW